CPPKEQRRAGCTNGKAPRAPARFFRRRMSRHHTGGQGQGTKKLSARLHAHGRRQRHPRRSAQADETPEKKHPPQARRGIALSEKLRLTYCAAFHKSPSPQTAIT